MQLHPQQLAAQLEQVGVRPSPPMQEVLDTFTALQAARDANHTATAQTATADGKLTPTNAAKLLTEHAQRLVVADKIRAAYDDFENPLRRVWYAAIREAHADLLEQLRERFAEPANVAQSAGRFFGSDPTPDDILAGGPEAVELWQRLSDALSALSAIRSVRAQIADIAGEGDQQAAWWVANVSDAPSLQLAHRVFSGTGDAFLNLAHAGFELALNSAAEADRIVATAQRVTTERQAKADQERAAAFRATLPDFTPAG